LSKRCFAWSKSVYFLVFNTKTGLNDKWQQLLNIPISTIAYRSFCSSFQNTLLLFFLDVIIVYYLYCVYIGVMASNFINGLCFWTNRTNIAKNTGQIIHIRLIYTKLQKKGHMATTFHHHNYHNRLYYLLFIILVLSFNTSLLLFIITSLLLFIILLLRHA